LTKVDKGDNRRLPFEGRDHRQRDRRCSLEIKRVSKGIK